jgi:beta-galactosidase GanA
MKFSLPGSIVIFGSLASIALADESSMVPHLEKRGTATQLIVDGKPMLVLGGELHNSSSSSLDHMKPIWPKLVEMHLNTVVTPVYWELIEPTEGKLDFTIVDGLIRDARKNNLHLVFLWFGSWKNSMSCYAPEWVKTDLQRFPRAQTADGKDVEILSPFSTANCAADARVFAALLAHIRLVDGQKHTVIMVQVENEIGMIPEARDHSAVANDLFSRSVPKELMNYLAQHKDALMPEFRAVWETSGFKSSGTWEEVFGNGIGTEEIFMAWYFARYTDRVAAAGKAVYPLPMYVNAALNRTNSPPGKYPSGGPLPHLMDVWRAGALHIDFLSPDIYFPNFAEWCEKYRRSANPLFIPEMRTEVANLFYAIGQCDAMGVSPFGIEDDYAPGRVPSVEQSYKTLSQLSPLILKNAGTSAMAGFWLDQSNQTQKVILGDYSFNVAHEFTWPYSGGFRQTNGWPRCGGIIIPAGANEFFVAGTGLVMTFASNSGDKPTAGIVSVEEGTFVNGRWAPGRRLNGDEDHQGRQLHFGTNECGIQKVKLYQYR